MTITITNWKKNPWTTTLLGHATLKIKNNIKNLHWKPKNIKNLCLIQCQNRIKVCKYFVCPKTPITIYLYYYNIMCTWHPPPHRYIMKTKFELNSSASTQEDVVLANRAPLKPLVATCMWLVKLNSIGQFNSAEPGIHNIIFFPLFFVQREIIILYTIVFQTAWHLICLNEQVHEV